MKACILSIIFASAVGLFAGFADAESRITFGTGIYAHGPSAGDRQRLRSPRLHQRFPYTSHGRQRYFEGYRGFGHPIVRGYGRDRYFGRAGVTRRHDYRSPHRAPRTGFCKPVSEKFRIGDKVLHHKATICRRPDGSLRILN